MIIYLLAETDQLGISVTVSSTELSYLSNTLVSRMMRTMKYSIPRLEPGYDGVILFRGEKRQGEDILINLRVIFDIRRSREEMQHLLQLELRGGAGTGQGLVHVVSALS